MKRTRGRRQAPLSRFRAVSTTAGAFHGHCRTGKRGLIAPVHCVVHPSAAESPKEPLRIPLTQVPARRAYGPTSRSVTQVCSAHE